MQPNHKVLLILGSIGVLLSGVAVSTSLHSSTGTATSFNKDTIHDTTVVDTADTIYAEGHKYPKNKQLTIVPNINGKKLCGWFMKRDIRIMGQPDTTAIYQVNEKHAYLLGWQVAPDSNVFYVYYWMNGNPNCWKKVY